MWFVLWTGLLDKLCRFKQNVQMFFIVSSHHLKSSVKYLDVYVFNIYIDWLVFNTNFSSILAISWREQILHIRHLQDS
jgi:hypothetical protein